ncbi:CRISPR-associated protein Csm4 [Desulfobotulus alkaliphilus]|uniref:CRISPR system Cms protein Csm4 n=1 Tax=Desulfobotulus alkaliphilus TaxID=622671 RepID=A0A562R8Q9_9BACT|nr:hypothetical protein [Desulfobotulus alkaliphilus]TWI64810.1 CRISPR-associated protein Csm4 [Desulfobotulus alkaliphilus]
MQQILCTLKPCGPAGTPFKGDTLFGQLCWEFAMSPEWMDGGLDVWMERYVQEPFLVVSSAFILTPERCWLLPVPHLPWRSEAGNRMDRMKEEKEKKKCRYMLVDPTKPVDIQSIERLSHEQTLKIMGRDENEAFFGTARHAHNTISRMTGTTGKGMFAPYETRSTLYAEDLELGILIRLNTEAVSVSNLQNALERMGKTGYGRDASTGFGRFELTGLQLIPELPKQNANAAYLLAPGVPEPENWTTMGAMPFVRYGKHGNVLATSGKPFKSPVLMASEGSVMKPVRGELPEQPWLGRAVTGVSEVQQSAVVQGYALWLPVRVKEGL